MKTSNKLFRNILAVLLLTAPCGMVVAQDEDSAVVDFDFLAIPNSPAFSLLGISPSDVNRPTTPADFAVSIADATNNLTALPSNYAVEFMPLTFFNKHKLSYKKFTNDYDADKVSGLKKLRNNIGQTFLFSAGFTSTDTVNTEVPGYIRTRSGIGFKCALVRGKLDETFEGYVNQMQVVWQALGSVHEVVNQRKEEFRNTDPEYTMLVDSIKAIAIRLGQVDSDTMLSPAEKQFRKDYLNHQLVMLTSMSRTRIQAFVDNMTAEKTGELYERGEALRESIMKLKYRRWGFMMDLAGGTVLGFRNDDIQNSIVENYSFWLNGGYVAKKYFSFMALARANSIVGRNEGKQNQVLEENTFDVGGKLEFNSADNKFSLSGEVICRMTEDDAIYRYTLNAGYQVGKNQALTFSMGKAFEGATQYGGTLLAALNYIRSFGSKRSIDPRN